MPLSWGRATRSRLSSDPRAALWAFVVIAFIASAYYFALARRQWFYADEWDFLARRTLSPHFLVAPHFGHWAAVPIVVYRVLWELVGLRSYLPYVGLTIVLHLIGAALLRAIMRRSGVGPWIATAGASVFVLFGGGAEDIFWALQITYAGSLVFGLTQILLLDHAGGVDRRDWYGLAAGVLGLMCSGVYVTMAIVVGITALLRRGWRIAALHTVPLGLLYICWWALFLRRPSTWRSSSDTSPRQVAEWSRRGATSLFTALGHVPIFGLALFVVFVIGSILVARRLGPHGLREHAAAPVALALGVPVFLATTGINRGQVGAGTAASSRYQDVLVALLIPALVLAVDALVRPGRLFGSLALVVLLAGVPGNIADASRVARDQRLLTAGLRHTMLSIAREPLAAKLPPALRPEPDVSGDVTLAWLRAGVSSGRIPKTRASTPAEESTNRLRLSLMELNHASGLPCRRLGRPTALTLRDGESIGVGGTVHIVLMSTATAPASAALTFGTALLNRSLVHTLVAVAGPLVIQIIPAPLEVPAPLLTQADKASKQTTSLCRQL